MLRSPVPVIVVFYLPICVSVLRSDTKFLDLAFEDSLPLEREVRRFFAEFCLILSKLKSLVVPYCLP